MDTLMSRPIFQLHEPRNRVRELVDELDRLAPCNSGKVKLELSRAQVDLLLNLIRRGV